MANVEGEEGRRWAYTARGCEGPIDVEEADGVLDGAVLEGRNDAGCFDHCGAAAVEIGELREEYSGCGSFVRQQVVSHVQAGYRGISTGNYRSQLRTRDSSGVA